MLEPVMIFSPATVVPDTMRLDGDAIVFDTSKALTMFIETGETVSLKDFQVFGLEDSTAQVVDIVVSDSTATIILKRIPNASACDY